jgi:hypothetical protein
MVFTMPGNCQNNQHWLATVKEDGPEQERITQDSIIFGYLAART